MKTCDSSIFVVSTRLVRISSCCREGFITNYYSQGCQDIDDALHARRLPNGNVEAGVRERDVLIHSIKYPNEVPLQISQMSLILFSLTTRWTSKPLRVEQQYILLINV